MRAWDHLRHRQDDFDIVQDNQCLGYGLLLIERQLGIPVLGTIHHPITVDRRLEIEAAERLVQEAHPAPLVRLRRHADPGGPPPASGSSRCRRTPSRTSSPTTRSTPTAWPSCPWASTSSCSSRCPRCTPVPGRLVTTASADVAMKGLKFLLEAVAKLRTERDDVHLVVIGQPQAGRRQRRDHQEARPRAPRRVRHRRRPSERIVELYSEAELAVVPSLYEGFSLPAIEAMSCGVPARGHHRRRHPRGRRPRRRHRHARAARRQRGAGRQDPLGASSRTTSAARSAPGAASASSTAGAGSTPP